jgi:hypothetical protein
VTLFSKAFRGATGRSHREPALTSALDSLGGYRLHTTISGSTRPGTYPVQLACDDGSIAGSAVLMVRR